jgi:site-specific DNA recombinase
MASAGTLDRVYVHSPDRLARKYAYQVLLIDELHRCGVEVVFLNHEVGKSPEEELLLQVQGMVAEYERAKIMERSRRGKLHAARQGSVNVLSGAPYGYRYVTSQDGNGEAHYEIRLEEARVVRQIFEWIGHDRLSISQVCRRLQQEQVLTRTGKPTWDRTTVWGMLKNPAYKGMAAYGKTRVGPLRPRLKAQRGHPQQPRRAYSSYTVPTDQWISIPVPPLVEEDLFEIVQEQLAENQKRNRQHKRGATYLLQGLLVCRTCGYAYYGKPVSRASAKGKTRSYAYYRCIGSDAYRFGGQRLCDSKPVRTDLLEAAVWQDVCQLLQDPQRVEQEFKRRLTSSPEPTAAGRDHLQAQISKVRRGIARLIDAYQEGLIGKGEFEPRIAQAKERLEKLQQQIHSLQEQESQRRELKLVVSRLEEFSSTVNSHLEEADWSTKRELVRTLVKQIELEKESVKVVYRIADFPFVQAPEKGRMQDCLGSDYPALRAALIGFMEHLRFYISCFQPLFNQFTSGYVSQGIKDKPVADVVKRTPDIRIQDPGIHPFSQSSMGLFDGILTTASGTKPIAVGLKAGFPAGFQRVLDDSLCHPVHHGRNT